MKHIKGPWKIKVRGPINTKPVWFEVWDSHNEIQIAETKDTSIPELNLGHANLIAASPYMLRALEKILSNLTEVSGQETGAQGPIYKSMWLCRQATTKAKGES